VAKVKKGGQCDHRQRIDEVAAQRAGIRGFSGRKETVLAKKSDLLRSSRCTLAKPPSIRKRTVQGKKFDLWGASFHRGRQCVERHQASLRENAQDNGLEGFFGSWKPLRRCSL
jgi:hypothetical protein